MVCGVLSHSIGVTNRTSTSVDPKDYLTSVDSVILKSDVEIGETKCARMLFDSLVKSQARSRVDTAAWMAAARKIIKQGCKQCPKSGGCMVGSCETSRKFNSFFPLLHR